MLTAMLSLHRLILEREGPRSLFRGLGPNLVGVAPSRYFFFPVLLKLTFQCLIRGPPFLAPSLTCKDQMTERRDTRMLLKNTSPLGSGADAVPVACVVVIHPVAFPQPCRKLDLNPNIWLYAAVGHSPCDPCRLVIMLGLLS